MPINESLNKILNEVWRIDEKISDNQTLTTEERKFYNKHLETINSYYLKNSEYWKNKETI
jgi:hypothetical protein